MTTDDDPLYFGRDGQPLTLMEWSDQHADREIARTGHEETVRIARVVH